VPADERPPRSPELTDGQWLALLEEGEAEVEGRLPWSSNATFLVTVRRGDRSGRAVYKPGRGERGLWDFPGGLYRREVAAFELDRALGLGVIPATVLRRDAPFGEGSLQRFIEADFSEHYFSLREEAVHLDALRVIAAFDLLANNADRKGGHLLVDDDGRVWAIDNGLSFHAESKLRTVMWDFIGEAIPEQVVEGARRLTDSVPDRLASLLDAVELAALVERAERVVARPVFPEPDEQARLPWPLV
jgi:uncharacterized repeat protein (TIGR03843 family)